MYYKLCVTEFETVVPDEVEEIVEHIFNYISQDFDSIHARLHFEVFDNCNNAKLVEYDDGGVATWEHIYGWYYNSEDGSHVQSCYQQFQEIKFVEHDFDIVFKS